MSPHPCLHLILFQPYAGNFSTALKLLDAIDLFGAYHYLPQFMEGMVVTSRSYCQWSVIHALSVVVLQTSWLSSRSTRRIPCTRRCTAWRQVEWTRPSTRLSSCHFESDESLTDLTASVYLFCSGKSSSCVTSITCSSRMRVKWRTSATNCVEASVSVWIASASTPASCEYLLGLSTTWLRSLHKHQLFLCTQNKWNNVCFFKGFHRKLWAPFWKSC